MITMQRPRKAKRVLINPLYKDKATMLKSVEETGGRYVLGELEVQPGGGNHLHVHSAFSETFIAVKGTLGVMLNKRKHYLKPGDSITIPIGIPHCFFNDGTEMVVCHVKFEPGHDNFFKGLAIAYGLASDGKTNSRSIPKSLTHLALIMSLTDTRPVGKIGLLMPIFKWLAARARRKGVEEALLNKYYYEDVT